MDLRLKNKRAAVTGATKGIGRAIAEVLASEGCSLILAARSGEQLKTVSKDLTERFGVSVEFCAVDLAKTSDQVRLADFLDELDILINCAGSNPPGQINAISDELWRNSWDLKVFGYINLIRLVYAKMKVRHHGTIINIIGNSGERMNANYILGSSGNLALMGLTRALGAQSPDFGIRVVGVNPGATATERIDFLIKGWSEQKYSTPDRAADVLASMDLPFGRLCEPEEVADAVAFLASPRASYISGTILTVDGGGANRNT